MVFVIPDWTNIHPVSNGHNRCNHSSCTAHPKKSMAKMRTVPKSAQLPPGAILLSSGGTRHTETLGPMRHRPIILHLLLAHSLAVAANTCIQVDGCIIRVRVLQQAQHSVDLAVVTLLRSVNRLLRYPIAQHIPACQALMGSRGQPRQTSSPVTAKKSESIVIYAPLPCTRGY